MNRQGPPCKNSGRQRGASFLASSIPTHTMIPMRIHTRMGTTTLTATAPTTRTFTIIPTNTIIRTITSTSGG